MSIRLGKYKHHKGKFYQVLDVVKHSETLEDLVYYRCLYDNPVSETWVRPLSMFTELVTRADGTQIPRFEYVGE